MLYCTFAEALRELKGQETAESEPEAKILKERLWQVSRRIDKEMTPDKGVFFAPIIATRTMPLTQNRVKDGGLSYQTTFPLLEVTTASLKYRTQTTAYTDRVELLNSKLYWSGSGAGWQELYHRYRTAGFVVVNGVWGYHHDYASAWVAADTITEALDATETGITVGDVDADDLRYLGERYSYGTLIRIGDEMMLVLGVDASTNELTVQRGVNGSVAATHEIGATVEVFQVEDPIRRITARQTALLYARRGAFESQTVDGFGVTTYPQDLLLELRATLGRYQFGG